MFLNSMVSWLNSNDGAVMAVLTFVYAIATIFILIANRSAVKESRLAREAENRPYVIAYLQFKGNRVVNFVLTNTGNSVAQNVKLSFDKDIDVDKDYPLYKSNIVKEGLITMPPGFEIKHFLGVGKIFTEDEEGKFPIYTVTISYYNANEKKNYQESYSLDFNVMTGSLRAREYEMNDLVKEVKAIRKKINQ